ncbi:MAG: PfkB family carbohydrate kinase [Chloroflexota bacterium]
MNSLGGGGVYAAAGMRLWQGQVILWGRVGPTFDLDLFSPLKLADTFIKQNHTPTPRAWQLYEVDGTRTQIPRVSAEVWQTQLVPTSSDLPDLSHVQGVHLSTRGYKDEIGVINTLRKAGVTVSLEPIISSDTSDSKKAIIIDCLRLADIFSPGLNDAELLFETSSVDQLFERMAALGPHLITLRQGANGSTVYDRDADRYWQIPAVPTAIIDVTGGGNAYCGGFLTGWIQHQTVEQAAAQAAVSAALTIEQVGPPAITDARLDKAQSRQADCLAEIIRRNKHL